MDVLMSMIQRIANVVRVWNRRADFFHAFIPTHALCRVWVVLVLLSAASHWILRRHTWSEWWPVHWFFIICSSFQIHLHLAWSKQSNSWFMSVKCFRLVGSRFLEEFVVFSVVSVRLRCETQLTVKFFLLERRQLDFHSDHPESCKDKHLNQQN